MAASPRSWRKLCRMITTVSPCVDDTDDEMRSPRLGRSRLVSDEHKPRDPREEGRDSFLTDHELALSWSVKETA